MTSVEGNISFSHSNLGPVNQLEDSSSLTVRPGGVVCRIFISRDISPLLRVCAEINFLHPVSYERVKTLLTYPKTTLESIQENFSTSEYPSSSLSMLLTLTETTTAVNYNLGMVVTFVGATRDFTITRAQ